MKKLFIFLPILLIFIIVIFLMINYLSENYKTFSNYEKAQNIQIELIPADPIAHQECEAIIRVKNPLTEAYDVKIIVTTSLLEQNFHQFSDDSISFFAPGSKIVLFNDQVTFNKLPILEAFYRNLQPNKYKEISFKFTPFSAENFKIFVQYQLISKNNLDKKRNACFILTEHSLEKLKYYERLPDNVLTKLNLLKNQVLKDEHKISDILNSTIKNLDPGVGKYLFFKYAQLIDESNNQISIHFPQVINKAISYLMFLLNRDNIVKKYPIISNQLDYLNYPVFCQKFQVTSSHLKTLAFHDSTKIIIQSRHTDSIISSGIGITGKIGWTAQSNHIKLFEIQTGKPLFNLPLQEVIFSYNDQRIIFYDPNYDTAYVLNMENGIVTAVHSPQIATTTYFSMDHRYCIQLLRIEGLLVAYDLINGKLIVSKSLTCRACDASEDLKVTLNDNILTVCGGLIIGSHNDSEYRGCMKLNLNKMYPEHESDDEKYNIFEIPVNFNTHNLYKPIDAYENLRSTYSLEQREYNIRNRFQETLSELTSLHNLRKEEDLIVLRKIDRGIRIIAESNVTDPVVSIVSDYLGGISFYESFHKVQVGRSISSYNFDENSLLSINDSSFEITFYDEKKAKTPTVDSPFYSKDEDYSNIVMHGKNWVFPVENYGWACNNYYTSLIRNQFHPTGIHDADLRIFFFNNNNSKCYIPNLDGITWLRDKFTQNTYIPIHIENDSIAYFYKFFSSVDSLTRYEGIYKFDFIQNKIIQKVQPIISSDLIKNLFISEDKKYILQTCTNGEFYLYAMDNSNRINGFYSDDEVIFYLDQGYYDAEIEAEPNVFIRFYNPLETFQFHQFEHILKKPHLVKGVLISGVNSLMLPTLPRPPQINFFNTIDDIQMNNQKINMGIRYSSSTNCNKIKFYLNGLFIEQKEVTTYADEITTQLPLVPGCNIITTIIFDSNGLSSTPLSLRVTNEFDSQPTDLYIISVGINDYPNLPAQAQLKYAASDAKGILQAFKKHHNSFRKIHSVLLQNEDASKENIMSSLNKLETARPYDLVILSFAGHGVKQGNDFYYLTCNSDLQNPQYFGLNWKDLSDAINRVKAKTLIFLDACHSGHISVETIIPNDDLSNFLIREGRQGVIVLSSAKGKQQSIEAPGFGGGHGLFTYMIIRAFGDDFHNVDTNRDNVLEFSELNRYVRQQVSLISNGNQTPWLARNEVFGDFPLVYK